VQPVNGHRSGALPPPTSQRRIRGGSSGAVGPLRRDEPGYASLQHAVELVASRPGLLIVSASARPPVAGLRLMLVRSRRGWCQPSARSSKPWPSCAAADGQRCALEQLQPTASVSLMARPAGPAAHQCSSCWLRPAAKRRNALLPRFTTSCSRRLRAGFSRSQGLPRPSGALRVGRPGNAGAAGCVRGGAACTRKTVTRDGLVQHAAPVDLARVVAGLHRLDALSS
jgi:hypothetical protein